MKKMIFALVFMMAATICVEGHRYSSRHFSISVQTFYDELMPYGEWLNTPDYGYVWRPYLDDPDDFRPYASGGNWVYTDLGWTWVSDYLWGWATFHYGRWYFDDYLGWMWIPGNEWAPAWVTWGSYNDYWAWAPMGPNIQVNVNVNWYAPAFWWTFVPYGHFCSQNWHSYIYNHPVQITNITYITNIYYGDNDRHNRRNWYHGPRVRDVESHLNGRVSRMQLVDADKPDNLVARNNRVSVYRPDVTNSRDDVRPGKYRNAETVRTDPKNIRTNVPDTKRKIEPGAETRKANQTMGNPGSSRVSTQPVKRNATTERMVRNSNVTNTSGQPGNENNSGTAKINRTEPARDAVNRSQSPRVEPDPVKRNSGNDLNRNKTTSKPSTDSRSTRSSSSSRTR